MTRALTNRRTRDQVKAEATALRGTRPKVTFAATTTSDPPSPPDPGSVGELWLYGVVGGWWSGFSAESVSRALRGLDVDTIYVRIHSPGGSSSDGIAIANLLRNHKAHIVTVVDGIAASAASVIATAGDDVVMCPGSQLMLHDAWMLSIGNAAELHRDADWIDGQSQNYAGVYAYRAGGDAAHWREVMLANEGDGTWYTADDAVTAKLADRVGTVIAQGSPPTAPDDQLDDEDDDEMYARIAHDLDVLQQQVHPAARAAWHGKPPKPPTASADGTPQPSEGATLVDFTDEQIATLRQQVGFPEDADAATITAAIAEALDERAEPAEPATQLPTGHVAVPQVELDDLRAGAAAGTAAARQLHEQARAALLDANRAKYLPDNRAAWEAEYDRDPQSVRAHFEKAPDIIPVSESGHAVDANPSAETDVRETPVYKNWRM